MKLLKEWFYGEAISEKGNEERQKEPQKETLEAKQPENSVFKEQICFLNDENRHLGYTQENVFHENHSRLAKPVQKKRIFP